MICNGKEKWKWVDQYCTDLVRFKSTKKKKGRTYFLTAYSLDFLKFLFGIPE